jgi:hypothetical protein
MQATERVRANGIFCRCFRRDATLVSKHRHRRLALLSLPESKRPLHGETAPIIY